MKAEISKASMALIMIKKYLILIFFLISRIFATATYSSSSPAVSSFEPRVLTLFVSLAIGPSNKSVNPANENSRKNETVNSPYHNSKAAVMILSVDKILAKCFFIRISSGTIPGCRDATIPTTHIISQNR